MHENIRVLTSRCFHPIAAWIYLYLHLRAAARAVSRLSAFPANQPIILAAGVIPYLFKLLPPPCVREERYGNPSDIVYDDESGITAIGSNTNKAFVLLDSGSDSKHSSTVYEETVHYATLAIGNLSR